MPKRKEKDSLDVADDPDQKRKYKNNVYQRRCRSKKEDVQLMLHLKCLEGECYKEKFELLKMVVETWNQADCTHCTPWISSLLSTLERMPATGTAAELHQALKDLTDQFDDAYIDELWATERAKKKVQEKKRSKLEEVETRMSEASMKVVIGELKDEITELSTVNQQLEQQNEDLRQDKHQLYEIISHFRQLYPEGYHRTEEGYVQTAPDPTYATSTMLSETVASIKGPMSSQFHGFQDYNSWAHSPESALQMPMTTQTAHAECQPSVPPAFL